MVLEAKDYEMLLGAVERGGQSAVALLDAWRESSLATVSFWNWITSERTYLAGWPTIQEEAAERVLDRAVEVFEDERGKADQDSP